MLETFLVPPVLGREWNRVEDIVEMFEKVKQNRFAKAGLEMASWDILAQAAGQPLYVLLGGSRKTIESGVSLGIEQDVERLCGLIDRFLEEGYRRIKLKIAPGRDVDVVRRVRERHPEVPLMVDANSAYRLSDLPILKALDDFKLMLIEQPLAHDDIVDHATLQREIRTPVCLDESIHSSEDARKALDLESCRVINVKVSRLGGLLEANGSTIFVAAGACPSGVAECTSMASGAPRTWPSQAFPASACRGMCPDQTNIMRKIWSIRRFEP